MKIKQIKFKVSVVLIVMLFSAFDVSAAKKGDDVSAETVKALELKVQAMQMQLDTQAQTLATLGNQVNEVVSRFQMVSGQVGVAEKKNFDQDGEIKEADLRLQVLEDKALGLMSQLQELKDEGFLKPKSVKNFDEYKNYSLGLESFNGKNYPKAVTDLRKFQQTNKNSLYWSYAQFWIGESYYMQSDYQTAILEYEELLKNKPKSAKAPLALYRQGMSFVQLQSFDDAKAFFTKVTKSYPGSLEAVISQAQIDKITRIQDLQRQQENELKAVQ